MKEQQIHAIFDVLGKHMHEFLKKMASDPKLSTPSPRTQETLRVIRAAGIAQAKQGALLTVLAARSLSISAAQRARVLACADERTLDKWIKRAATADSVDEALGPAAARRKPAARARRSAPRTAAGR